MSVKDEIFNVPLTEYEQLMEDLDKAVCSAGSFAHLDPSMIVPTLRDAMKHLPIRSVTMEDGDNDFEKVVTISLSHQHAKRPMELIIYCDDH